MGEKKPMERYLKMVDISDTDVDKEYKKCVNRIREITDDVCGIDFQDIEYERKLESMASDFYVRFGRYQLIIGDKITDNFTFILTDTDNFYLCDIVSINNSNEKGWKFTKYDKSFNTIDDTITLEQLLELKGLTFFNLNNKNIEIYNKHIELIFKLATFIWEEEQLEAVRQLNADVSNFYAECYGEDY